MPSQVYCQGSRGTEPIGYLEREERKRFLLGIGSHIYRGWQEPKICIQQGGDLGELMVQLIWVQRLRTRRASGVSSNPKVLRLSLQSLFSSSPQAGKDQSPTPQLSQILIPHISEAQLFCSIQAFNCWYGTSSLGQPALLNPLIPTPILSKTPSQTHSQ